MLACALPKQGWTHEAHLSTCLWLIIERPDVFPERDLPGLIRRFNESVGGQNTDTAGYHETITQLYIRGVRAFLAMCEGDDLLALVNGLLKSPMAPRDWPLRFYSRERLFSVEARRGWIEPEIAASLL
ncbi:hypothetical protein KRR38_10325 [Novosphingobium sp. G106]|uniref:hypothetical protein n=1 Tax=Novosphingobium sp. G106 TaxID=2849500 RepID=UPI001C2D2C99|nr:hypothetical protein [Novosphingobium sp. G106]MBV1688059.1 hypothetical protein [Novosphingobium sp. G106]